MISDEKWNNLDHYAKNKILAEEVPHITKEDFVLPHVGFYIGVESSSGDDILLEGILHESLKNVVESVDLVTASLAKISQDKDIEHSTIQTSTFHLTMITACTYVKNPLSWDENKDGVFFQWGQQFKGMYLPHQIKKMNCTKLEILDKLCSWEGKICSSAWRQPCGLIWKLTVESYSS